MPKPTTPLTVVKESEAAWACQVEGISPPVFVLMCSLPLKLIPKRLDIESLSPSDKTSGFTRNPTQLPPPVQPRPTPRITPKVESSTPGVPSPQPAPTNYPNNAPYA